MAVDSAKKTEKKRSNGFVKEECEHPLSRCKPRGDRVVVRRDLPKKSTAGGILLPDSVLKSKMPTGVVWSVGPGRVTEKGVIIPVDLHEGDKVILTSYAGMEIRDPSMTRSEEDEFVMLREEDVVAFM